MPRHVWTRELDRHVRSQAALRGALAAAVAIMVSTAWVFAEPHVKAVPRKALLVVPGAIALALGAHLSPVKIHTLWIIGVAALLSFATSVAGIAHERPRPQRMLVEERDRQRISELAPRDRHVVASGSR